MADDHHCDQITHGLKSVQLEDENASKYFINYINEDQEETNDSSAEHRQTQRTDDNRDFDLSELPNSLIITSVPQQLFINQEMKNEFEQLFRVHDPNIIVLYLKFFQRVRITFSSSYAALQARLHLHEYVFHGQTIKTYFASPIIFRGANPEPFLRPPEPEKLFLISPPSSPPVGWEQKVEDPPIVDLNLIAALAQLQPNQSHELFSSDHGINAPSIVIHTCDDPNILPDDVNNLARQKLIKPTLVQTRRPPASET